MIADSVDRPPLTVANASGYYLVPLMWIGAGPRSDAAADQIAHMGREVYRRTLSDGTTAKVMNDGLFLFDFTGSRFSLAHDLTKQNWWEEAEPKVARRLQIMNTHLACLYSAMNSIHEPAIEKRYLNRSDLILAETLDASVYRYSGPEIAALYLSQHPGVLRAVPELGNPGFTGRWHNHTIKLESVLRSFDYLSHALSRGFESRLMRFAGNILRAMVAMENDDTGSAIIEAWTIVEDFLVSIWLHVMITGVDTAVHTPNQIKEAEKWKEKYDNDGETPPFNPLLKFLVREGRIGSQPDADLRKMHEARSNWIHRGLSADMDVVSNALFHATIFLKATEGIDFNSARTSHRIY